jgi:hypothetical protein
MRLEAWIISIVINFWVFGVRLIDLAIIYSRLSVQGAFPRLWAHVPAAESSETLICKPGHLSHCTGPNQDVDFAQPFFAGSLCSSAQMFFLGLLGRCRSLVYRSGERLEDRLSVSGSGIEKRMSEMNILLFQSQIFGGISLPHNSAASTDQSCSLQLITTSSDKLSLLLLAIMLL